MLDENHFTKEAYEDNGRFQIHPLSSEGLEAYLSKDSYNYHYLKSKYDPLMLKQIEEELTAQKEQKIKKNQNIEEQNKLKENPKTEDLKIPNNIITKDNNVNNLQNNNKKAVNKNSKIIPNKNNKRINKNTKKNDNIGSNNMNKKIGSIGHAMNPVISNVKNDRGRLKDFQQPYQA